MLATKYHSASNAIDGNAATFWESSGEDKSSSHQITVDMGAVQQIAGFSYLPRQDSVREAIVQSYRFETSADGEKWTVDVNSGHFANVRNNPVVQEIPFAAVAARFFRFTALQQRLKGQRCGDLCPACRTTLTSPFPKDFMPTITRRNLLASGRRPAKWSSSR